MPNSSIIYRLCRVQLISRPHSPVLLFALSFLIIHNGELSPWKWIIHKSNYTVDDTDYRALLSLPERWKTDEPDTHKHVHTQAQDIRTDGQSDRDRERERQREKNALAAVCLPLIVVYMWQCFMTSHCIPCCWASSVPRKMSKCLSDMIHRLSELFMTDGAFCRSHRH